MMLENLIILKFKQATFDDTAGIGGDIIKDTIVKEYIGNPEIFADVFNFFLYDGEQKIKPENLTEKDVTELVTLPAATGRTWNCHEKWTVSIKRSQMHKHSKQ